jgi:hypothetical protein
MVCSSSEYKLKKKLGSDTRPTNEKFGTYEFQCGTRNCGYTHIGQTRRSIKTRFKEHLSHINNDHIDLSSVAHHMKIKLRGGGRLCVHKFDVTNMKLLKNVTDSLKLDAYESRFSTDFGLFYYFGNGKLRKISFENFNRFVVNFLSIFMVLAR